VFPDLEGQENKRGWVRPGNRLLLRIAFLATAAKNFSSQTWLSVNILASNESCQNFYLEVSVGLILAVINCTEF
jgi:hypothetical protein